MQCPGESRKHHIELCRSMTTKQFLLLNAIYRGLRIIALAVNINDKDDVKKPKAYIRKRGVCKAMQLAGMGLSHQQS